jgi:hypothetical protein
MSYVEPSQQQQSAQPTQPAEYHPGTGGQPDAYKRSGMTKEKLLKRYRMRLDVAKKYRDKEGYEKTWKRLRDMYRGKVFTDQLNSEDRIAVNIAFSTVNVIVPSVAVNYPTFSVNARRPEEEPNAETVEAMINYWWRHYDWREVTKDIAKDSLVYGHGWAKIGWTYEQKTRDLSEQERADQFDQQKAEADQVAAQAPERASELPTDDDIMAGIPTQTMDVVKDCPFIERVSPFDLFVDPEATCMYDAKWIAQRIVVPLEQAQHDGRYNRAARNKLVPDASTNPRYRDDNDEKYDDDVKRVTVWEFYDLDNKMYATFAEKGEGFLIDPTDYPYPYGQPFRYLGNYSVPDMFYDLGDLEMIEPLQAELNALRSDMHNHRKRYQRAYLALRDKFSPEALNTLASDEDNRIVFVEGDENLQELVVPIPQLPLDPNMYQYSDVIENDIEQVSGVSDYQRGAIAEGRRTATEASIIQDSANARAADKLAQVETFLAGIASLVVELAQAFLTGDDYARVLGPNGLMNYIQFDAVAIEGQYDFEVEAGSTQPKNEQFKQQQAQIMAQTLQPYVGVVLDPNKFVTYLLREGYGMKNPEELLIPMDVQIQNQLAAQQAEQQQQQGQEQGQTDSTPPENTDESGVPQNAQAAQLAGQVGLQTENF